MKKKIKVVITNFKKKVSVIGNPYYLVSFQSTLDVTDENGNYIKKDWNDVYFAGDSNTLIGPEIINSEKEIEVLFMPSFRIHKEEKYLQITATVIAMN